MQYPSDWAFTKGIKILGVTHGFASNVEMGALLVIIEAREGGKGVGIFDKAGAVDETEVDEIVAGVGDLDKLMWEAPIKNQQQYMILRLEITSIWGISQPPIF